MAGTLNLHVERYGEAGAAPDIVLLHGWAMHGGVWADLPAALAAHCCIHVIDLPGHGNSRALDFMSLDTLCDKVEPAVPQDAILVGWSLGAQLALQLARRHWRRLGALVLIGATPRFVQAGGWLHGMPRAHFDAFSAQLADDAAATLRRFVTLASLGSTAARARAQLLQALLAKRPTPRPTVLQAGLDILRDTDLRGKLSAVQTPTWIIHDTTDAVVPAAAGEWLAQELPYSRIQVFHGTGHVAHLAQGERVARIILEAAHARTTRT